MNRSAGTATAALVAAASLHAQTPQRPPLRIAASSFASVESRTGAWGTDHDATKGIGRITLAARTTTDIEDALTFYLDPESTNPTTGYASLNGKLRIRWGTLELSAHWTVKS